MPRAFILWGIWVIIHNYLVLINESTYKYLRSEYKIWIIGYLLPGILGVLLSNPFLKREYKRYINAKNRIIKRLEWYYPTELFNAWLFTGITLFVIYTYKIADAFFLVYGLIIMTFILFQGQHYWKLKLYRLTNKKFDEAKNLKLFKKAKQINLVLIAIIPFVFTLQWLTTNKLITENNLFLWGILANVIGVLEHINYYHRQLMIDNLADIKYLLRNKRLKVASLKKDLDESKI